MNKLESKDYFVESKKVIQIVLDKEEEIERGITTSKKLELVKGRKDNTSSIDNFKELEKMETELEFRIRSNNLTEPAIPDEYKEKVLNNVKVEYTEQVEKLNELKAKLKKEIDYLSNNVIPLIEDINTLESLDHIPLHIDILLDGEIGENQFISLNYRLRQIKKSKDEVASGKALISLYKVVDALENISIPNKKRMFLDVFKGVGK